MQDWVKVKWNCYVNCNQFLQVYFRLSHFKEFRLTHLDFSAVAAPLLVYLTTLPVNSQPWWFPPNTAYQHKCQLKHSGGEWTGCMLVLLEQESSRISLYIQWPSLLQTAHYLTQWQKWEKRKMRNLQGCVVSEQKMGTGSSDGPLYLLLHTIQPQILLYCWRQSVRLQQIRRTGYTKQLWLISTPLGYSFPFSPTFLNSFYSIV